MVVPGLDMKCDILVPDMWAEWGFHQKEQPQHDDSVGAMKTSAASRDIDPLAREALRFAALGLHLPVAGSMSRPEDAEDGLQG